MSKKDQPKECGSKSCGCGDSLDRRNFLKITGLAVAGATASHWPAIAGPFTETDFEKLLPSDKKLDPAWVKSLSERGEPTLYRAAELDTIGMPIGGICAGQLYLGGDGRLWHWDIFNIAQPGNYTSTSGPNYAKPPTAHFPIEQGFAVRVKCDHKTETRCLDARGFSKRCISFKGQYPIAEVVYDDPEFPVVVILEAYSPFIPLDPTNSALPATIMSFQVVNRTGKPLEVEIVGWLENGVCLGSSKNIAGQRKNEIFSESAFSHLLCTAASVAPKQSAPKRSEIVFEDFEKGYQQWHVQGEAFGEGPAQGTLPQQQTVSGFKGKKLVNTFLKGDTTTGLLASVPFKLDRRYIAFLIGGGSSAAQTCIQLLVGDKIVRTATGRDEELLDWACWDVSAWEGREAKIQIIDKATGPWGHINIDQIIFTDTPPKMNLKLEEQDDFGSMGLAILGESSANTAQPFVPSQTVDVIFQSAGKPATKSAIRPFSEKLIGALGRKFTLASGAQEKIPFVIAWFFPGLLRRTIGPLLDIDKLKRGYAARFKSASDVMRHVASHFERLSGQTHLWRQTWYDSTLPYWFLDRTFLPLCTLATNTCYWFDTGRFYAFEGVYCCQGTCQHVWNYAQSVARIFPQLERDLRERTDFGTAWHDNGATDYRGECARHVAHDGQCGIILRAYREHLMSPDSAYLKKCWPRIRKSIEYLINCDADENGILEGEQYNTLDASWFGPMAWISSFYIAALRAGESMANVCGDASFAQRCHRLAETGSSALVKTLYNGEYFIHKMDPKHPESTNTNDGCHIDQLMGQAWAMQVGLPRIVPETESLSALEAIWKYNFTPDVGPFREKSQIKGGRWYAMQGEGGVVMTTFPRGGVEKATGKGHFGFYFNEVWTGQEHQLAAHMIAEGLVEKGLIITRMLHDRHHASRRNPYNEVECSDHYARAMSSYGSFIAICGYHYDGPQGDLEFAPKLTPHAFKAAFTGAEGWGSYSQFQSDGRQSHRIDLHWGELRLSRLTVALRKGFQPGKVKVQCGQQVYSPKLQANNGKARILFSQAILIQTGDKLEVELE